MGVSEERIRFLRDGKLIEKAEETLIRANISKFISDGDDAQAQAQADVSDMEEKMVKIAVRQLYFIHHKHSHEKRSIHFSCQFTLNS